MYKGVGDVSVEADVQRNYEEAIKALGRIDLLVLNAGVGWATPLEKFSVADYDQIFNTNVKGVFHVAEIISSRSQGSNLRFQVTAVFRYKINLEINRSA